MKAIKNKIEYQKALNMLNNVFNAKIGTTASNKADRLAILIENYELTEQLKLEEPTEDTTPLYLKSRTGLVFVKGETNRLFLLFGTVGKNRMITLKSDTVYMILNNDEYSPWKCDISKTFFTNILGMNTKSLRLNNNKTPLWWNTLLYTEPHKLITDYSFYLDTLDIDYKPKFLR